MGKLESDFKHDLIDILKSKYPGAIFLKNDPTYRRGVPDLIMLYKDKWAMFETKRGSKSTHRPGQDYNVDILDKMSFARFVYPENMEDVLNELENTLRPKR